jgi:predicted Zn-dependent protease with MMP-like domain
MFGRRGGGEQARTVAELLEAAESALDSEDGKRALRLSDDALRLARKGGSGAEMVGALTVRAAALAELGLFTDSERAAAEACRLDPTDAAALHQHGIALYRLGRFADAAAAFTGVTELEPEMADPWHALARCAVWLEQPDRAKEAFRRAAELDPDDYVVPVRIASAEFDRIASEVWRQIPSGFQALLDNTMVVAQLLPDIDDVEDGFDPDTLGVYEGATALHSGEGPERIVLFQRNHENACATLGELSEEIRRTILHEVGHHFGMEEGELPF